MIASSVLPVLLAIYIVLRLDNSVPGQTILQRVFYMAPMFLATAVLFVVGVGLFVSDKLMLVVPFFCVLLGKWLTGLFFEVLEQDLLPAVTFVAFVLAFSVLVTPYLNLYLFRLLGII